jgi:hypothetical protein
MGGRTAAAVGTLDQLCAGDRGGSIVLNISKEIRANVAKTHREAMIELDGLGFWRDSAAGTYRPKRGLWLPQRRAIAFAHAYLSARRHAPVAAPREAALVKMPTGTGKTAVIAALACGSPLALRTLILTPRAGLVHQMKQDLSYRFWGRALGAAYYDCEIHENVGQDELVRIEAEVKSGSIAPVRPLADDQYEKIWTERDQERQILVSTFNALHLILGLEPPAHRSAYGRDAREVAKSLRSLKDDKGGTGGLEGFRQMLKSVDLVIVDEGHYEPAYSWAQAVRAIDKPTIIFSATPYRNDYKYFQIDGNYTFNLPWHEAVGERLVREVRFELPINSAGKGALRQTPRPRNSPRYGARNFIDEFASTLAKLPKGKKAIIHAGTYQALKSLQRAFFAHGEAAVLIHDRFTGDVKDSSDLGRLPAKSRDLLKSLRFQHVRQTEESPVAQNARIWMHQYKLLEGVDDSQRAVH